MNSDSTNEKIYISNLSSEINNKILFTYFKKFGKILDYIVIRDKKTKASRGFGFVTFEKKSIIENIFYIDHELSGNKIKVSKCKKAIRNFKPEMKNDEKLISNKLFIGGIPLKTKLKEWNNYFSKYGNITDKVIIKNSNSISKGYGFITYKNIENAKKVIKDYNKHEIRGKWIEVKYAKPKFCNPKYNNNITIKNDYNKNNKLNEKVNKSKEHIIEKIKKITDKIDNIKNNKNSENNMPTISTQPTFIEKISNTKLKSKIDSKIDSKPQINHANNNKFKNSTSIFIGI